MKNRLCYCVFFIFLVRGIIVVFPVGFSWYNRCVFGGVLVTFKKYGSLQKLGQEVFMQRLICVAVVVVTVFFMSVQADAQIALRGGAGMIFDGSQLGGHASLIVPFSDKPGGLMVSAESTYLVSASPNFLSPSTLMTSISPVLTLSCTQS